MTRVLVIDDDPTIRELIVLALGDEGYDVDQASDGQAALELIGRQHPDVILLDMRMPVMDGWEFSRLYHEQYDDNASIIVITAARDVARRGADVNAQGYMPKPFDLDLLIEQVSVIAGKRKRKTKRA
jgi:two-component system chemotaxis response regulator CheY